MASINTRRSMWVYQLLGYLGLILVAGGVGTWSVMTSIHGAIIATGVTAVESYSKKVQHSEGGIVTKIIVKNGDKVEAGDLLVSLDETEINAQLAILNAVIAENAAKAARLKALRDGSKSIAFPAEVTKRKSDPKVAEIITGQENLFRSVLEARKGRDSQLNERISQLEKEITGHQAQLKSRQEQAALIAKELTNIEGLHKQGLVPVTRVLALQREKANLEGQQGQLSANIASARGKIGEIRLQILSLKEEDRSKGISELRDVESKLAEMRERRIAAQARLKRTAVRAPQSGYVHQLGVHTIGGVVAPREVIMLIVPALDDLVVEARISPQDIDSVRVGQVSRLRFSAFSQRTTPEISGKVTYVSADLTQVDQNTPPFYAVKVKMLAGELEKLGDNKVIPGMPVEVFIQTEARTPLNYLIKPLKDQIMRAFRES